MIARAEARARSIHQRTPARGIHQRASAWCIHQRPPARGYIHQRTPAGGNIRRPGLLHAPEGPGFSRGILRLLHAPEGPGFSRGILRLPCTRGPRLQPGHAPLLQERRLARQPRVEVCLGLNGVDAAHAVMA
jgi:hypothetical protein